MPFFFYWVLFFYVLVLLLFWVISGQNLCLRQTGRVPRAVASLNQHVLTSEDVVSCCLDLGAPSISFRINGQPVQGMFENFNTDGLFFPVVSFSAGVK